MLAENIINTVSGYIPFKDFVDTPSSKTAGGDCDSEAVARTARALCLLCNSQTQNRLKIDVSSFVLLLDADFLFTSQTDESASLQLVKDIAEVARAAAPAHACSSVLAGHASESDEYEDIGLWLPANAVKIDPMQDIEQNAKAVLLSLGLDSLLRSEIMQLSISEETKAPVAFRASIDDADVRHLASLLGKLTHPFAFGVAVENVVFHFLLGQAPGGDVWAGLFGVGTWSD